MGSISELIPLFPSATHPGLPIAAQILSTLRQLTAPGKGNDLRAEERAALVGVAALLGCERVQSKDLVESSAQKASAVSPARFKSALAASRRILESVSDQPQRYTRTLPNSTSSTSSSTSDREEGGTSRVGITTPSPFSTPKKKFKYTSGTDLTGLIVRSGSGTTPHQHSPAKPSPLKHSASTSASASASAIASETKSARREDEAVLDEKEDEDEVERTPTKRAWYGRDEKRRREIEGREAFFALRPGSTPGAGSSSNLVGASQRRIGEGDIEKEFPRIPSPGRAKVQAKRPRKDWTFNESVWYDVEVSLERFSTEPRVQTWTWTREVIDVG